VALRVGIDLVVVDEIREALATHGDHYLHRVFTSGEQRDCTTPAGLDPARLAARFAVKEATMKVLRIGDHPMPWTDIEVRRAPEGWVDLELAGRAAALAAEVGISDLAASLTHERGHAAAVVVAEIHA
jgi:holo-[acyl-carrier protein] synthase